MNTEKLSAHPLRFVFARNMRKVRRWKEISQEALALNAEISRTYLGEIERGSRSVSIDVMGKIADALGVELINLLKTDYPIDNLKEQENKS